MEAPKQLEALLSAHAERSASQAQTAPQHRAWAWGLSFALLAGVLWAAAVWQMHRSHAPIRQTGSAPPPSLHSSTETAALATPTPKQHFEQPSLRHARSNAMREPEPGSRQVSMDDFVALPASEGLPPASAISLVRMQFNRTRYSSMGLKYPPKQDPEHYLRICGWRGRFTPRHPNYSLIFQP